MEENKTEEVFEKQTSMMRKEFAELEHWMKQWQEKIQKKREEANKPVDN